MPSLRLPVTAAVLSALQLFSPSAFSSPVPGKTPGKTILVTPKPDGTLAYAPYTDRGDTIPDFSHCGYQGGGVPIPDVPVRETLAPLPPSSGKKADDTARIQAAIDRVSALPLQPGGLRGAVFLKRGVYRCSGVLRINATGVVLRGEGPSEKGTLIIATARKQQPLIRIGGSTENRAQPLDDWKNDTAPAGKNARITTAGPAVEVTDAYVPVGTRTITLADASAFAVGQTVYLTRRGNAAWIHEIAMDRITPRASDPQSTKQWTPFNLRFDRVITTIDGNRVTLDAPLACAIDKRWGGGSLQRYTDPGRIENCGVENLASDSIHDPAKTADLKGMTYASDEDHATYLVSFDTVKNAWGRNLATAHYYHGPALLNSAAKWITVQDCRSLAPVCIITGGRRYPYNINGAQLSLIQRCESDKARHAFVFGARVPGPNVFLRCKSTNDYASSEPHHRWSTGGLYDNVTAKIAIQDRQHMGSGHGWAGANYVAWNCGGELICQQPPTAQNFAIGFTGQKGRDAFPRPQGWWESTGKHVTPESLYEAQLKARIK
jgi:hypothetical protein